MSNISYSQKAQTAHERAARLVSDRKLARVPNSVPRIDVYFTVMVSVVALILVVSVVFI